MSQSSLLKVVFALLMVGLMLGVTFQAAIAEELPIGGSFTDEEFVGEVKVSAGTGWFSSLFSTVSLSDSTPSVGEQINVNLEMSTPAQSKHAWLLIDYKAAGETEYRTNVFYQYYSVCASGCDLTTEMSYYKAIKFTPQKDGNYRVRFIIQDQYRVEIESIFKEFSTSVPCPTTSSCDQWAFVGAEINGRIEQRTCTKTYALAATGECRSDVQYEYRTICNPGATLKSGTCVADTTICEDKTWTPDASARCTTEQVTQTSNCGRNRVVPGTLMCAPGETTPDVGPEADAAAAKLKALLLIGVSVTLIGGGYVLNRRRK